MRAGGAAPWGIRRRLPLVALLVAIGGPGAEAGAHPEIPAVAVAGLCPETGREARTAERTIRPGLRVVQNRETYPVEGADAAEILASMRSGGRPVERGETEAGLAAETAFGWTDARTRYEIEYARRGGSCRMTRVDVVVEITVTLPRWTPPSGTPVALRHRWNRFRSRLEAHEAGHVRIARRGGARLLRELEGLSRDECGGMKEAARTRADAVLAEVHEDHIRYDRETGNGRTQGVVWKVG